MHGSEDVVKGVLNALLSANHCEIWVLYLSDGLALCTLFLLSSRDKVLLCISQ
jgi:hypothetical protein